MKEREFNRNIKAVVNASGTTWIAKGIYIGSSYISFDKVKLNIDSARISHMTKDEVIDAINQSLKGVTIDSDIDNDTFRDLAYKLAAYKEGQQPQFIASYEVPNFVLRVV